MLTLITKKAMYCAMIGVVGFALFVGLPREAYKEMFKTKKR